MTITATFITGYEFGPGSDPMTDKIEFASLADYEEWKKDKQYWGDGDEILKVEWNC
jgi:hypothetical protein